MKSILDERLEKLCALQLTGKQIAKFARADALDGRHLASLAECLTYFYEFESPQQLEIVVEAVRALLADPGPATLALLESQYEEHRAEMLALGGGELDIPNERPDGADLIGYVAWGQLARDLAFTLLGVVEKEDDDEPATAEAA